MIQKKRNERGGKDKLNIYDIYNKIYMKFYIPLLLICVCVGVDVDKNTFSNYKEVKLQHLHIEWLLNLSSKIIDGSAEYTFKVTTANLKEV